MNRTRKTERYINRKIRPLVLTRAEFDDFKTTLESRPHFLVWEETPNASKFRAAGKGANHG